VHTDSDPTSRCPSISHATTSDSGLVHINTALPPIIILVMARYSHKGHDSIRYDITQNIAIRYDPKVLHHM